MTKEEYQKLIDMTLNLRTIECMLYEMAERLGQVNKVLKELILKREDKDALV